MGYVAVTLAALALLSLYRLSRHNWSIREWSRASSEAIRTKREKCGEFWNGSTWV